MAKSQNGYPANDINLTTVYTIPGTTRNIRLRKGPAGELLVWVLAQFHARVEDLDDGQLDDWGYAERTIRGSTTTLSNHASGTAADANATRHPLGTDPSANFSAAQIREIRAILREAQGAVRWGGDYAGRKDPMHFEIVEDEVTCGRVLADLTGGGSAAPTPSRGGDDMALIRVPKGGSTGKPVNFPLAMSMLFEHDVIIAPGGMPVVLYDAYNWGWTGDDDKDMPGTGGNPVEGAKTQVVHVKGSYSFIVPKGTGKTDLVYWADDDFTVAIERRV